MGLIVNGVSVFILGDNHDHEHEHHQDHEHEHHDHNLRAAYLHVLADTLTSVLAIFALLAGKFIGLMWMDPLMGIVGSFLVARWSLGLIRTTSGVLLDKQGPASLQDKIKSILEENDETKVTDLHIWSIGPRIYSVIISITSNTPETPTYYKNQLPTELGLEHITIEINHHSS
jgi:cation diffusion facilitator family transporter